MSVTCPYCAESIDDAAIKCKYCGEFLEDPKTQHGGGSSKLILALVLGGGVCFVVMIIGAVAAISIPNLLAARKNGNETSAIGGLRVLGAAQALFRESDKDADGILDYGTLKELSSPNGGGPGLIDSLLASGTKNGYLFEASYGVATSEFLWFATANPAIPGTTGDRYFATNHEGVTYYSATAPIPMNTGDCSFPQGRLQSGDVRPVGR